MKRGNWVPMSKALVSKLPTDRSLSEPEAMLSLSVNYDNDTPVSIAGLAGRWGWSRGKVKRFLERVGAGICYPENTSRKQNQNGQIVIQMPDRSVIQNGQIRIIDSKGLPRKVGRSIPENEQIADRSQYTINDPDPEPIKNSTKGAKKSKKKTGPTPEDDACFMEFWKKYPRKINRPAAFKAWIKQDCTNGLYEKVMNGLEKYLDGPWRDIDKKYIPHGSTWINGEGWNDEIDQTGKEEWY